MLTGDVLNDEVLAWCRPLQHAVPGSLLKGSLAHPLKVAWDIRSPPFGVAGLRSTVEKTQRFPASAALFRQWQRRGMTRRCRRRSGLLPELAGFTTGARGAGERLGDLHPVERQGPADLEIGVGHVASLGNHEAEIERIAGH